MQNCRNEQALVGWSNPLIRIAGLELGFILFQLWLLVYAIFGCNLNSSP